LVIPQIDAVVFDMDGLLFDTEVLFFEALAAEGVARGVEVTRSFFLTLVGLNVEKNHELMRVQFGTGFPAAQFHEASRERFFELLDTDLRLKPGVVELLEQIEALGLPKAIATSSQRQNVDHHLAAFGLANRFDAIIANGDYAKGKPDPDPFLVAAQTLGARPAACLALEDSHNGVRSAAAAGMVTIMVPDLLPANDEMRALASHVAADLHEVARLLLG
jgi:HAD superfamily hydrolase (TIGR01509 family)